MTTNSIQCDTDSWYESRELCDGLKIIPKSGSSNISIGEDLDSIFSIRLFKPIHANEGSERPPIFGNSNKIFGNQSKQADFQQRTDQRSVAMIKIRNQLDELNLRVTTAINNLENINQAAAFVPKVFMTSQDIYTRVELLERLVVVLSREVDTLKKIHQINKKYNNILKNDIDGYNQKDSIECINFISNDALQTSALTDSVYSSNYSHQSQVLSSNISNPDINSEKSCLYAGLKMNPLDLTTNFIPRSNHQDLQELDREPMSPHSFARVDRQGRPTSPSVMFQPEELLLMPPKSHIDENMDDNSVHITFRKTGKKIVHRIERSQNESETEKTFSTWNHFDDAKRARFSEQLKDTPFHRVLG